MRRVTFSMALSLDGYIGGQRGGGGLPAPDEELHRFHNDQARELDLHLLGRGLYEVMTYWDSAEDRNPSAPDHALEFARIWKALPKIVYSKTLEAVGPNTRLSRGDPAEEVRELKERSGGDIAVGGAALAATLTAQGLVDEYWPLPDSGRPRRRQTVLRGRHADGRRARRDPHLQLRGGLLAVPARMTVLPV